MKKFENNHCPNCGELKVNVHKLQNNTFGVWCDNCLFGIPNKVLRPRFDVRDAIDNYNWYVKYFF